MTRWAKVFGVGMLAVVAGCHGRDTITVVGRTPEAPRGLDAWYYDRAVYLVWDLAPAWDGEPFRVYGKRRSDSGWFRVAEVANCSSGSCSYTDVNVVAGVTYEYFVSAVDPSTGEESEGTPVLEVYVPDPVPPPVPEWSEAVALDGGVYLRWDEAPAGAADFSHFRVHQVDPAGGPDFLLGETDSNGFLDERAVNGSAYTYRVTAVDVEGHESLASPDAAAIPRPDYHGEWLWAYQEHPASSGFRFQATEETDPVVDGDDVARHFRLEVDVDGLWLVAGPSSFIYEDAFVTTALRCGPGSDASCVELTVAPASGPGYGPWALEVLPQSTYVFEVAGDDGAVHYGAVRIEMVGTDQAGSTIVIFDWAYQLAAGVRALAPGEGDSGVQVSRRQVARRPMGR